MPDKLEALFRMQRALNEEVFARHPPRFTDAPGAEVSGQARFPFAAQARGEDAAAIWRAFQAGEAPAHAVRDWLLHFARAIIHEAVELSDSCNWKWWSDDPPVDMQNARVEVVDLWHFLLSATIVAGMTPADLFEVYRQKWEVNRRRQGAGYSRATKDEAENRAIRVRRRKKKAKRKAGKKTRAGKKPMAKRKRARRRVR